jgi:hypothetical protein
MFDRDVYRQRHALHQPRQYGRWSAPVRHFAARYLVTVRIATISRSLCNREGLKHSLGADQHGQVPGCGQYCLPLGAPQDRAMLTFHGGGFIDNTADSRRNMMATPGHPAGARFAVTDHSICAGSRCSGCSNSAQGLPVTNEPIV